MLRTILLFLILGGLLAGCGQKSNATADGNSSLTEPVPSVMPANPLDVIRSVCTLYSEFAESGPSCIIVSTKYNGVRRYAAITAAHVLNEMHKKCAGGKIQFGFPTVERPDRTRRNAVPYDQVGRFAFDRSKSTEPDLGFYVVTGAIPLCPSWGVRFNSIDLDTAFRDDYPIYEGAESNVVAGCGIALKKMYDKLKIGPGTRVISYCTDPEQSMRVDGFDWNNPLKALVGELKLLDVRVKDNKGSDAVVHIMKGEQATNKTSGSPVFALVRIGQFDYPVLIGVIMGNIPNTDESTIVPIDQIIEKIFESRDCL